jgi:fluoride ion exporter CrcB/FEX
MDKFLLISAGAVLGANARYWIGTWGVAAVGVGLWFGKCL